MAYWDSKNRKMVYFPDESLEGYPGWVRKDCGCCGGIQWGGDEPRECGDCGGYGAVCEHIESGVRALYPGGPFV